MTALFIACGNSTKENDITESIRELSDSTSTINSNTRDSEVIEDSQNFDYLKIVGDSVEIPYFEIELKLSKKAEEKLRADNETIIVSAYFTGENDDEDVFCIPYQIELTNTRLARFENIKFSKSLYDLLERKDIHVLVNVFSGRKSSEFNILRCDILDDNMSAIKEKRFTINGKLIYNDD